MRIKTLHLAYTVTAFIFTLLFISEVAQTQNSSNEPRKEANRIKIIIGGYRRGATLEYWIVLAGAQLPKP